jgi:hypothetical protein
LLVGKRLSDHQTDCYQKQNKTRTAGSYFAVIAFFYSRLHPNGGIVPIGQPWHDGWKRDANERDRSKYEQCQKEAKFMHEWFSPKCDKSEANITTLRFILKQKLHMIRFR